MNKLVILIITILIFSSCADHRVINNKEYRPYGVFNQESCKNDSVYYEVSGWAVFSGIVFCELIAPTIYTFGYNLWEPKCLIKDHISKKGNGVVATISDTFYISKDTQYVTKLK